MGEGVGWGEKEKQKRKHTHAHLQSPLAEEEQVDRLLLALDVAADVVDIAQQARVRLHEDVLPSRVECLQFGGQPVAGLLGPADEVDAWPHSMLGEALERGLADARRRAGKDGDGARRDGRSDAGVGRLDQIEGDHCDVYICVSI